MGTKVIGTVIDQARRTLLELSESQDTASDKRWGRTRELLPIANSIQRLICIYRPSAFVKSLAVVLQSGLQQAIPADGQALRKIEYNMGVGGATVGRAIELIDRTAMTNIDPNWPTASGAAIELCIYDQDNPKAWYPYPRPSGTWYVMESYFAIPAEVASANIDTAPIQIDDVYVAALVNGILGYALLKNSTTGDQGKAAFFLSLFAQDMGVSFEKIAQSMPLDQPAAELSPNGRP